MFLHTGHKANVCFHQHANNNNANMEQLITPQILGSDILRAFKTFIYIILIDSYRNYYLIMILLTAGINMGLIFCRSSQYNRGVGESKILFLNSP